ncbi:hypothetical protein HNR32_000647 [Pectinatus brassicae]|uniref:Uncharacterized protein n=1 Tax=Pectinatus brassicae TaxID=862415 RepID=A0A840UMP6_9FIRM|nr:hypothetical protein [Pectinatus brassicae]
MKQEPRDFSRGRFSINDFLQKNNIEIISYN